MMAYSRMQFDDVPQEERDAVFNVVLSYCELDTLAMVIIVEAWKGFFWGVMRKLSLNQEKTS